MASVRPRGAPLLVENGRTEDLRPLAESEHRGAGIQRPRDPCSAGCRTSLRRSACSPGNHRSADAHHSSLEWTALGAARDASQFALSRRANPRRAPELRTDRVQALFALARQSQTYASPVRLEWLSDQVPTRFKRLNGLCRGAAGCRLKFRECRRGPRERVGTGEEAERHPLGRTEFAVIALSLYEPSHLQQELCRFAR